MSFRAALMVLFASLSALPSLTAQEWTRFRGPDGSGQSETQGLPVEWTDADYAWKAKLPGIGHSSPVLWDQKIFLMSADPQSGTRHVMCVSNADGKVLWTRDYPATTHALHQQNSFASSTPAVDGEQVYCAWGTPEALTLVALSHEGEEAWRANLGPFVSQHGFGASPILFKDLVILPDEQDGESFFFAVDRRSGQTRWKIPRKTLDKQNTAYAAPFIYRPEGGDPQLIVSSWAHGVCSLDPLSGSTHWELGVLPRRPVGSPILVDGLILANCGEGSGNNSVVAVRPPSAEHPAPEVIYKLDKTTSPYVPTMVAKGPLVFLWGDRGVVSCIDAPTGKVHWQRRVGGNYSGSPVRVGNAVYCASADGEVVVLAASKEYELLGRSQLGEGTRATPAVANGRLYFRTESQLLAIGPR